MSRLAGFLLALALVAACAVTSAYIDPKKPHHTAEGFRNNYPHAEKGGFWRWKREQWRAGLPAEARARAGLSEEEFFVLRHGETRRLR